VRAIGDDDPTLLLIGAAADHICLEAEVEFRKLASIKSMSHAASPLGH